MNTIFTDFSEKKIIWITFLTGTAWMIYLLFASEGTPMHDEIGHYLISRDAFSYPAHLFDLWGRPFNTLLYLIPAQFGLTAVRFLSLLLAVFTAYCTLESARLLSIPRYYLAPFFLFFQPWFCDLSYLCLTQIPFSFIMILSVFLYLKNRSASAALIVGLLPLIRHEGLALTILWAGFLMYRREWRYALLPFMPLILFNIAYYLFMHSWPFLMYFDSTPTNYYGKGTWYHFLIRLPHPRAAGIPILLLALWSLGTIIKSSKMTLIFTWYFIYFLMHTVIFKFGLFASGGYKLFLLPLAPALSLMALIGMDSILAYSDKNTLLKNTFSALTLNRNKAVLLLCSICLLWTFIFVKPFPMDNSAVAIKKAVQWIKSNNLVNKNLVSTHVYFYHLMPREVPVKTLWEEFAPPDSMETGTMVIWDSKYSDHWGIRREYLLSHPEEWILQESFANDSVMVFLKQ